MAQTDTDKEKAGRGLVEWSERGANLARAQRGQKTLPRAGFTS